MIKKTNRVLAMLLCLVLCLGLFPAAYAEEIISTDTEEAIIDAADYDAPITEITDAVETETESGAPEELVIQTEVFPASEEETPDETEAWELLPEPVNVQFLTDEEENLAFFTVTDVLGERLEPVTDPDTGLTCFGLYALLPGNYVWRFHDESGLYADQEADFTVEEGNTWQFLTVYPELTDEVYTFSYTYINPIYEGVITEDDIPAPTLSEEEITADLRDFVEAIEGGGSRTDAKFRRTSGILNTTVEAAGLELRQQIKEYEDEATIYLVCETKPDADMWKALGIQIAEFALAHTGSPTEGDYLRYEFGGYEASGAIKHSNDIYYCSYVYTLKHFTNAAQEKELDEVAEDVLKDLALDGKSDYEKISAIYQYLCTTVKGSGSGDLKYTAYGALVQKGALCQGFSSAFYRLCLAARVDTRMVTSSKMSHAWNIVKLGSRYYYLDATWDSNYTAANYRYFLKGSDFWLKGHKLGGVSELGDQFEKESFASAYSVPAYDYAAVIVTQPDNCSVFAGRDVNIAVEATGGDLVYQWETRKNEAESWQNVEGAVSAALGTTALLADNGCLYRCKISNSAGTLYTDSVSLEVKNYQYEFSLNLAELIGINFYVRGADSYEGLTISWIKKDGTRVTKNVTDGRLVDGNIYFFTLDTFSSKEMTVPVPVVIKDAKGNVLMNSACSVKSYCDQVYGMQDAGFDAVKELCRATMDYGTFAQIYFNYRTDDLANPNASADALQSLPNSFRPSVNTLCTGIKGVSFALALMQQTEIHFLFYPESDAVTIDQYTITAEDKNGNAVDAGIYIMADGAFCVSVSRISAPKLADAYTVKLQNKADGTTMAFTSAALGYAWMQQTGEVKLANVCKALYNYYLKADAVF